MAERTEQLWFLYARSRATGEEFFHKSTASRKVRDRWMNASDDRWERGYVETWCYGGNPQRPYDSARPVWAGEVY